MKYIKTYKIFESIDSGEISKDYMHDILSILKDDGLYVDFKIWRYKEAGCVGVDLIISVSEENREYDKQTFIYNSEIKKGIDHLTEYLKEHSLYFEQGDYLDQNIDWYRFGEGYKNNLVENQIVIKIEMKFRKK